MALPPRIRCLYFTLGMSADDDGFVGNPNAVCRLCGATRKDLQLLEDKGYLLRFDSGVVVLIHWHVCNQIRRDRYKPTAYMTDRDQLTLNGNLEYLKFRTFSEIPGCQSGNPV